VELNRAGITFFVIEHNMEVVMNFSHFVIVMANGRVLTQGEPYQVQRDPKTLQAFLGGHDGSAED
jgi:ABC-type branched-subunit amino acid transport system ATPase component